MTMFQPISAASNRVMEALIAGLEIEFGSRAAEGLAQRFLAAEDCDFHWDARAEERWLGAYESIDGQELELDRVAICGVLGGQWFAACMIIDGEGQTHGMINRRLFRSERQARRAFTRAI